MKIVSRYVDSALPPISRSFAETRYDLAVPQDGRRSLAVGWLMLGLAALIGSGVFSVLHEGQGTASGPPHSLQNLRPDSLTVPQLEQSTLSTLR